MAEVELSVTAHPDQAAMLRKVETISNAIWLDSISKASQLTMFLNDRAAHGFRKTTIRARLTEP